MGLLDQLIEDFPEFCDDYEDSFPYWVEDEYDRELAGVR